MTRRVPEVWLAVAVSVLLATGGAFEAFGDDEPGAPPAPQVPEFRESASFCPGEAVAQAGRVVAIGSVTGEATRVGIEPGDRSVEDLAGDALLLQDPGRDGRLDVVGYGPPVAAAEAVGITGGVGGLASARCSPEASSSWYFAAGSNVLGFDERLVVVNPFPEDAVVKVTLFAPSGEIARAGLADVPVPARGTAVVALNEHVDVGHPILGAAVEAERGRVVAWKLALVKREGVPDGAQMTLGATATSPTWYFPEGMLAEGYREVITLLNPSDEEAVVSVSLTSVTKPLQPPELVEIAIPPRSTEALPFAELVRGNAKETGGVSATVGSTNGVGIVAERTVSYEAGVLQGTTSEIGATAPATRWWVPPATTSPESDFLSIMNPGSDPAHLSVTLIPARGEPLTPGKLRALTLKPGARTKIPLGEWTRERAVAAHVTAGVAIVVERTSSSAVFGDVASVLGVPAPESDGS